MNYTNAIHVCPEDRLTFLRTVGVFGAVRDIFSALLNGAGLFPLDIKEQGVTHLANWLIRGKITILFSGAPLFRNFLDNLVGDEVFQDLRLIRLGSDSVRTQDVERYKKHFSADCVLVNGLSSSETGTVCKYFIDKDTALTTSAVPVGYPLEDMKIVLLDENGSDVGVGHIGVIAAKSRYFAPGYWRRPELTRSTFRPDPVDEESRICLTGDLGIRHSDGCLEHLGRKDSRAKIRGFRVDLSEIEARLLELDNIKDVVVVVREDAGGEKRLVAYLVPARRPPPTITTIRHALSDKLPDYMVPTAFAMVDVLPLNANGKVDRLALPAPDNKRPDLEEAYVAPRTPVEEKLEQIWAEVLGLEKVGVNDDFFELGGHSLLMAQLISRIRQAFGADLPLLSLYQAPTVASFADIIVKNRSERGEAGEAVSLPRCLVMLRGEGERLPLFCIPSTTGYVDIFHGLALHLGDDQPVYGLEYPGLDGQVEPLRSFEALASEFIRYMRLIQPRGPYCLFGFCTGGFVGYEMARQLSALGEPVGMLAMLDVMAPGAVQRVPGSERAEQINTQGNSSR
jgi:acyl carrier protein